MGEHKLLVPKTKNPPAKIKDSGIINLVKDGKAAYNAKSGETLFLPEGEAERRTITDRLRNALFEVCGLQAVGCGGDDAIFSLAERYAREWGDDATGFCDERGREIRIVIWSRDRESALEKARLASDAANRALRGMARGEGGFSSVEDASGAFSILSRCEAGAIGAKPGYFCPSCERMRLPDSPLGYAPKQSGADEPEETPLDIETPGANTIAELCGQLGIDVTRTIKAMLYVATDAESRRRAVASFVRGDYNLSMAKLSGWLASELSLTGLRSADKAELHELIGEVAGYCGPVGMPSGVVMICDDSVASSKNMVVGANRPGYHKKGCCHPRDFDPPIADIAQITEGTPCECGGSFEAQALRETGRVSVVDASPDGGGNIRLLSYRDREGAHEYPWACVGSIFSERAMMALHSDI
jgi:prolyl-tRNA synthetase